MSCLYRLPSRAASAFAGYDSCSVACWPRSGRGRRRDDRSYGLSRDGSIKVPLNISEKAAGGRRLAARSAVARHGTRLPRRWWVEERDVETCQVESIAGSATCTVLPASERSADQVSRLAQRSQGRGYRRGGVVSRALSVSYFRGDRVQQPGGSFATRACRGSGRYARARSDSDSRHVRLLPWHNAVAAKAKWLVFAPMLPTTNMRSTISRPASLRTEFSNPRSSIGQTGLRVQRF